MKQRICFDELELEQFGPWREPTRFQYPTGLGRLYLPNEGGKSTMVAGLTAVLFGLPGRTDPAERGIARFRSWGGTGPCRGRLDLTIDDATYRIRRDFSTHETIVEKIDATGTTIDAIYDGNANPDGRTASPIRYREILLRLLGDLADEDLFMATALFTQPVVPAGAMGEALEKMIGGVGQVGGTDARAILFEEAKSLTRHTRTLGLIAPGTRRPTDQRTDGKIEELDEEIDRLEKTRRSVEDEFRSLVEIEEKSKTAGEKLREAASELADARIDHEQLEAFRTLVREYRSAKEAHGELRRQTESYDELVEKVATAGKRLAAEFCDLSDLEEEVGPTIEEAVGVQQSRKSLRETVKQQSEELEKARAGFTDCRKQVPDAIAVASDPVARLTILSETAEHWTKAIDRFLENEKKFREALDSRSKLSPVAVLPNSHQDALARFEESRTELEQREAMSRELHAAQRERFATHQRRRAQLEKIEEAWSRIESGPFLERLSTRSDLHRQIAALSRPLTEIERKPSIPRRRRWTRAGGFSLPAGILIGGLAALASLPLYLSIGIGLILFLIALFVLSNRPRETGAASQKEIEQRRRDLLAQLVAESVPEGPWLPDDAGLFDRARASLAQKNQMARQLEDEEIELPAPESIAAVAKREKEAHEDRLALEKDAKQIEEKTGYSPADAVRRYRQLSAMILELEGQRESSWRDLVGPDGPRLDPGGSEADPLARQIPENSDLWEELPAVAELLDLATPTLHEVYDRLHAIEPSRWERWQIDATGLAKAGIHQDHCASNLQRSQEKLTAIESRLAELCRVIGEDRLAASDGSPEKLQARLTEQAQLLEAIADTEQSAKEQLRTARGGPYKNRAGLTAALEKHDEDRRDCAIRIEEIRKTRALVESYANADPIEQDRIQRRLEERRTSSQSVHKEAQQRCNRLEAALSVLKPSGHHSVASLELEIAARKRELSTLQKRKESIARAWALIGEATAEFGVAHREELEESLDARFRRITGRQKRRIAVNEHFNVTILEEGLSHLENQLSQGTRDQLAFCLRLAVTDLLSGERMVPLILDDPFVHCDRDRLARICQAVETVAEERQILLLTQDERLSGWGDAIGISKE